MGAVRDAVGAAVSAAQAACDPNREGRAGRAEEAGYGVLAQLGRVRSTIDLVHAEHTLWTVARCLRTGQNYTLTPGQGKMLEEVLSATGDEVRLDAPGDEE
jgi:hypothetical protein